MWDLTLTILMYLPFQLRYVNIFRVKNMFDIMLSFGKIVIITVGTLHDVIFLFSKSFSCLRSQSSMCNSKISISNIILKISITIAIDLI